MDNYANTFSRGRCTNICAGGNNPLVFIAVQFSLRGHANATLTSKKEHSSIKIGCLKKIVTTWKFWTLHSHPLCLPHMFEVANSIGEYERQPFFTRRLQQTHLFSIPAMSTTNLTSSSSGSSASSSATFTSSPGFRGIATLSTTRQIQDLDMWRLREQQESYYWLLLGWPCCVWIVYRYLSFSNCHHRYHHFSCPIDENWCSSAEKWYLNHLQNAVGIRFHRLSTPWASVVPGTPKTKGKGRAFRRTTSAVLAASCLWIISAIIFRMLQWILLL